MASSSALTGLVMADSSRFFSTSPSACGGVPWAAGALSTRVVGSRKLAVTPTSAAPKVPSRYNTSTGRMLESCPRLCEAMDVATSTSTSTGATDFRAATKTSPSSATPRAPAGQASASPMPSSMPTAICPTSGTRWMRTQ